MQDNYIAKILFFYETNINYSSILNKFAGQKVLKSSTNQVSYEASWLNEASNAEHPWIDLVGGSGRGAGRFINLKCVVSEFFYLRLSIFIFHYTIV